MNIIQKSLDVGNLGFDVGFWRIMSLQADFTIPAMIIGVGGWTTKRNLKDGRAPVCSLALEFSPQMMQKARREYFLAVENGMDPNPVPDFEALNFDIDPADLDYAYLVAKILAHPTFAGSTSENDPEP
jgi:hypothetical protein